MKLKKIESSELLLKWSCLPAYKEGIIKVIVIIIIIILQELLQNNQVY
jgi:hypothetical protein